MNATSLRNNAVDPRTDYTPRYRAYRQQGTVNAVFSQNTRVLPAFGATGKIERNRRLTASVMNLNYGVDKRQGGEKLQETVSDPLGRDPHFIIQQHRVETSTLGWSRALIRPAAPQQVEWKNTYWRMQRTRALRPSAIGPFPIASLPRQSILNRLSDAFSQLSQQQG